MSSARFLNFFFLSNYVNWPTSWNIDYSGGGTWGSKSEGTEKQRERQNASPVLIQPLSTSQPVFLEEFVQSKALLKTLLYNLVAS